MTEMRQLREGMGAMYDYLGLKYETYGDWETDLVGRTQSLTSIDQAEKDAMTGAIRKGEPLTTMFSSKEQDAILQTTANSFLAGGGVESSKLGWTTGGDWRYGKNTRPILLHSWQKRRRTAMSCGK